MIYDYPFRTHFDIPQPVDTRIPFDQLIIDNTALIKSNMFWENYMLNGTTIVVTEALKTHALEVLKNAYGQFLVESSILRNFMSDVFIHFPVLMQRLAITRLIDAQGVVRDDVNTQNTVRTESVSGNVAQTSALLQGTSTTEVNVLDTSQKTTGTVNVLNHQGASQNNTTGITNTSGVQQTGNRTVNVNHNLPEQAISGTTGNFPTDAQGTPVLSVSHIQAASQSFNTSNPINTSETSNQTSISTSSADENALTTNNITVADTGSTNRVISNSGSDTSDTTTATNNTNQLSETVTSTMTNKQYAIEINTFLETANKTIAFKEWENSFAWVVGIV